MRVNAENNLQAEMENLEINEQEKPQNPKCALEGERKKMLEIRKQRMRLIKEMIENGSMPGHNPMAGASMHPFNPMWQAVPGVCTQPGHMTAPVQPPYWFAPGFGPMSNMHCHTGPHHMDFLPPWMMRRHRNMQKKHNLECQKQRRKEFMQKTRNMAETCDEKSAQSEGENESKQDGCCKRRQEMQKAWKMYRTMFPGDVQGFTAGPNAMKMRKQRQMDRQQKAAESQAAAGTSDENQTSAVSESANDCNDEEMIIISEEEVQQATSEDEKQKQKCAPHRRAVIMKRFMALGFPQVDRKCFSDCKNRKEFMEKMSELRKSQHPEEFEPVSGNENEANDLDKPNGCQKPKELRQAMRMYFNMFPGQRPPWFRKLQKQNKEKKEKIGKSSDESNSTEMTEEEITKTSSDEEASCEKNQQQINAQKRRKAFRLAMMQHPMANFGPGPMYHMQHPAFNPQWFMWRQMKPGPERKQMRRLMTQQACRNPMFMRPPPAFAWTAGMQQTPASAPCFQGKHCQQNKLVRQMKATDKRSKQKIVGEQDQQNVGEEQESLANENYLIEQQIEDAMNDTEENSSNLAQGEEVLKRPHPRHQQWRRNFMMMNPYLMHNGAGFISHPQMFGMWNKTPKALWQQKKHGGKNNKKNKDQAPAEDLKTSQSADMNGQDGSAVQEDIMVEPTVN